jgi:hypothetical protein
LTRFIHFHQDTIMMINDRNGPPPHEYWIPDFSDFSLPAHPGGRPFEWPRDLENYCSWLVDHLEAAELPLQPHHIEILYHPDVVDWEPEKMGGYIGYACFSQYYWFETPRFSYPDDFLSDPRPERVCDPVATTWESALVDDDGELIEDAIDLRTWLVLDCMFWRARQLFDRRCSELKGDRFIWSDIGWRPLLRVAVAKAPDRDRKLAVVRAFFEEFERFDTPPAT